MSSFRGRSASAITPTIERGPSRMNRGLRPSCERLETRELLSLGDFFSGFFDGPTKSVPVPPPVGISTDGRIQALYDLSLTRHPLYQKVTPGHVGKAPMFNPVYSGPKRLNVNVIGANARVTPQNDFVVTGRVLGPILLTDSSAYSFLINRGGAPKTGPFQGRSNITFDAVVRVTTGDGGYVASVSLLDAQGAVASTIDLPASSVRFSGNSVQVVLPANLLPPSGSVTGTAALNQYRFTFAAGVPGDLESDIAGFAGEFSANAIATPSNRKA